MDFATAEQIGAMIEEIVAAAAPSAKGRAMYGGRVFEMEAGNPKTLFAGFFVYDGHASLEFSHGARFEDPAGHLEGKGKHRRHVKLRTAEDVEAKDVAGFMAQAVRLATEPA
ncbi:hypothetical protein C882_2425 [Caenispirillum salinarum AK4]|uniref:YdhG-like domain-containing protein n=1 Tax=Caenispirillum salinarum AK4 TaxID=1238182 RepID=K9HVS8_9PROT|nr:DUF1801 domain-containing protein [Caenispirillum salinarum]EKV32346.1 hypothetical protein C882_2425 [Caenispirillum salinarum AK4]